MGKLDHRVPFPLTGEGHFLFFSMNDLAQIEDRFGGATYFELIELNVNNSSPKTIMFVLDAGLKDKDGKSIKVDWHKPLEWTLEEAALPIMDALSLSISGKSYSDMIKEAIERAEKLKEANAKALVKAREDQESDPFVPLEGSSVTKPTASSRGSRTPKSGR